MLLKVTGKISLDCNGRYSSIHRIYDYCYCIVTITVTVSSQYSRNMDIDCLTELNNNVNGQFTL